MGIIDQINNNKNKILNGAMVAVALFVAYRVYQNQEKTFVSLTTKRDVEIKKNQVLEEICQLDSKINAAKKSVNNKDTSSVINTIANIAKGNEIKIISIRPEKESGTEIYRKYPFELSISADSYHAIGKFISALENHPDIYYVALIRIKPQIFWQDEKQVEKISANLSVYTILFQN
jgi:Tfp pilus assembly protein PilO